MKRHHGLFVVPVLALAALLAGCWGSDKSTSLEVAVATQPAKVGSSQCTNTCHAATLDILGQPISVTWSAALHTTGSNVQCEDCHGGGGNHWGVGPIPYPNPSSPSCNVCHGFTGFAATAHGNPDSLPAASFFQAVVGDGSGQAEVNGIPVVKADNTTPVTIGEHIEECSRCHNPNQRFEHGTGNVLVKPNPDELPTPSVTCGSCHNGHDTYKEATIAQRTTPVKYPNFRPYFVDNNPASATFGAQVNSGDANGASVTASIYQPNGAVTPGTGVVDYTRVVGANNEINPERLCASCHTKGKYKYTKFDTSGSDVSDTHQTNVFSQYRESGHGDRNAPAFAEFSANPGAYTMDNGSTYPSPADHRSTYPWDMGLSSVSDVSADTTRNGSYLPVAATSIANNTACYKCHNGLTSLAYQDNVQGTSAAPVVFGDVTVTCLTCHDPHTDVAGQTKNTRKPVVMTEYTVRGGYSASAVAKVTFAGNVFLDNTPVPSTTGNATICVFCHQGRESGFTLFKNKIEGTVDNNSSFFNPHYLGTGAMLWARNGYEYAGKVYDANTAHQGANCTTCHMANPTADNLNGGHTWEPNVDTCNTASCHGSASLGAIPSATGTKNPDLDGYRALSDSTNYSGSGATVSICQQIKELQDNVIAALLANGIVYDDMNYPYFFKASVAGMVDNVALRTSANGFKVWTAKTWRAAFNLSFVLKGLPTNAKNLTTAVNAAGITIDTGSQTLVRNHSAAVHNHKYTTQLLYDALVDLGATVPAGATRVSTGRAATVYGTGQ